MAQLVQRYLDQIREEHADVNDGALADYIPELARVDPAGFGLSLSSSDGYVYESGDAAIEFTIQSISKPFTYALALAEIGQDAVDAKIGVEPSGEAFNEISVDDTTKTPKNPMINAGAITAVSLVPGVTPHQRFARIRDFYSACAGRPLDVDPEVHASETATGSRNRAIAYMLQSFGVLDADPDEVLDVYFRQCSIKVTSTDLARMAATLARGGVNPMTRRRVIEASVVQRTLSVMVTCGMYDAAGDWVSAVGMPAKSGVGGGIVAVLPGQLGIGVYSPLLDAKGNSVRGVRVCRSLSRRLGLHFLTVTRESRSMIRTTYDVCEGVRVYELHGDLLFAGAEQVLRMVERESGEFDVAILEVSRIDDINDAARRMLAGMRATLTAAGKEGFLVDPDNAVMRPVDQNDFDAVVFNTLDDAIIAAQEFRRAIRSETERPMSQTLVDAARELAGRILEDDPERLAHSAAVADRARELAATVPHSAAETLVAAAWLHDIGYSSQLKQTGFHPLDAAKYLRREGWPEPVCTLVAHHSGSRYVARVRGLDDQLREFEFVEDPPSDALAVADNTAGPNGIIMTVEERLRDKLIRHGPDSPNACANPERDDYICAAAGRVAHRLVVAGSRSDG